MSLFRSSFTIEGYFQISNVVPLLYLRVTLNSNPFVNFLSLIVMCVFGIKLVSVTMNMFLVSN